jgi:hypothetical protein
LVAPGYPGAKSCDRVAAGIRSEEVVIIRPNKPIGKDLEENLFHATVYDILIFGGTHTLCIKLANSSATVDVELANYAMRDLGYSVWDSLQVSL